MPHRVTHPAAGHRSANPRLYLAVSGDVDWDRWRVMRTVYPVLYHIEDLASRVYADLPHPDRLRPDRTQPEVNHALAIPAMNKLVEALHDLPPELIPIRKLSPLFALGFVLKLVPRMLSATTH